MFEVRVEGRGAVDCSTVGEIWSVLDMAYQAKPEKLFWSVDGVAFDMGYLGWQACCSDSARLADYLSI